MYGTRDSDSNWDFQKVPVTGAHWDFQVLTRRAGPPRAPPGPAGPLPVSRRRRPSGKRSGLTHQAGLPPPQVEPSARPLGARLGPADAAAAVTQ